MLVLVGLEHVERLLVGEAGVVDDLDAVADALLDRFRRARMRADALAARLASLTAIDDFLVASSAFPRRAMPVDVLAREVELDRVDAVLDEHAHGLAHLLRPA